jgi:signal transduction histidine kinase
VDRATDRLPQRIYHIASGLYFGAILLRSILVFQDSPILSWMLGLLGIWLALFLIEPHVSPRWPGYFFIYLICQSGIVFGLLSLPGSADFYGSLLPILCVQIMLRSNPKIGWLYIFLCALGILAVMFKAYGLYPALAFALIYSAGNVFLGTYALAMRRAQAARLEIQALATEIAKANHQLQDYSTRLEQLSIARERNRLARELHDSVTQTVFSMTLATQSATLTLQRDVSRVGVHLERLNQLAQSALAEMQELISELQPDKASQAGLLSALRRHLSSSRIPENLAVSFEVEGEGQLGRAEEQSLFRIAEEALHNIVKHSQASQARLRLHLVEPCWMEIEDQGQGFDLNLARQGGRVGLSSMVERAEEIGWELSIFTSPGGGTRIRVAKAPVQEGQNDR